MAAFWGFLFALLCVAMFVVGVVVGWALRMSYDEDQKKKERDQPIANYRANYSVCDPNKANKTDEVYNVINFGTPKFISRGEFYASAKGKNSSFLRYDPKSEDFIQENGTHMYCQEAIRDELEKRFLADDAVYIHWSGDNTYSRVIMKEDEADEGSDNTTSGD